MKKLFLLLFLFAFSIAKSQVKPDAELNFTNTTVHSLKFTVDAKEEFKMINWKDIKDIFSKNKNTDSISLAFELKKNLKSKSKYSFTVKGTSENIDGLISLSKKAIKTLNKIKS